MSDVILMYPCVPGETIQVPLSALRDPEQFQWVNYTDVYRPTLSDDELRKRFERGRRRRPAATARLLSRVGRGDDE